MSIVLVGYRGCGKSTIGHKLADRLWWPFVDTDAMVVEKAGKSIKEIFDLHGETAFREYEREVVSEVAERAEHVIALGGGAIMREENREAIAAANHKVIYLKCDPAELVRRIQADPGTAAGRPALTAHGGGIEEVRAVLAEREPVYRSIKTAELDVTHLSPEEACVYIARLV